MRILQLIDSLNPGGAERMAVNISNVLCRNGHDIVLCTSREIGSLNNFIDDNVLVKHLKKRNWIDIFAFIRLLKFIQLQKIELIHAHSSSLLWAISIKLIYPKIKVIWHDHFGGRYEDKKNNFIYKFLSPHINGVITVSTLLRKWAEENLKINKEHIVYINNFPFLTDTYIDKKIDFINIIYLANIRPEKDHLNLIKAIDIINRSHIKKPIRVIFAGKFKKNDDYYRAVINEIKALNLINIISVIGEIDNVSDILFSSDIGIICSIFEGLPVSLLEYGLAGLAVVVTNVGQCAEVVDYGNVGLIVPPKNPIALANALLILLEQDNKRIEFGKKFKSFVELNYGYENFLNQYEKLIKQI